jgi:hypothetical protein
MTSNIILSVMACLSEVFVRICGIPQILLAVDCLFLVLMTLVGKLVHVDEFIDQVIEGGLDEISLL